jgi:hypothetical protein
MEDKGVHVIGLNAFPAEIIVPSTQTGDWLCPDHYQIWYLQYEHVFDLLRGIDVLISRPTGETEHRECFYESLFVEEVVHKK